MFLNFADIFASAEELIFNSCSKSSWTKLDVPQIQMFNVHNFNKKLNFPCLSLYAPQYAHQLSQYTIKRIRFLCGNLTAFESGNMRFVTVKNCRWNYSITTNRLKTHFGPLKTLFGVFFYSQFQTVKLPTNDCIKRYIFYSVCM